MAEIIKIGALGIMGVLLAVQLKGQKAEYGLLVGIGLSIIIFGYAVSQLKFLIAQFDGLKQFLGASASYLTILFKVIGITYVCEFSSSICKDAGFHAVSDQIEILGKLSVIYAGLPIFFAVIEQIQGLM